MRAFPHKAFLISIFFLSAHYRPDPFDFAKRDARNGITSRDERYVDEE